MQKIKPISPTIHTTGIVLSSLVMSAIIFSWYTETEIVARGTGRLIPDARVQKITPQTRGKITRIAVQDGTIVQKNDILIEFDSTEADARLQVSRKQFQDKYLNNAVTSALIQAIENCVLSKPEVIQCAVKAFAPGPEYSFEVLNKKRQFISTKIKSLQNTVTKIDSEISKIRETIKVHELRVENLKKEQVLTAEKLTSAKKLFAKGVLAKTRLREAEAEDEKLIGAISLQQQEQAAIMIEEQTLSIERERVKTTTLSQLIEEHNFRQTEIKEHKESIRTFEYQKNNMILRAPQRGRVEDLNIFTIGGYVEIGRTLATIVPTDGGYIMKGKFSNQDIGFLEEGQVALIKFDAFPAERFGVIEGIVTNVASNAVKNSITNAWEYNIQIQIATKYIDAKPKKLSLSSGMTATVDIITGKRRLISYFFEPIIKAAQDGLRER